jgi:SpoVK/Ycf46/Vps4 family AAA+-type ATPase
MRLFSHGVRVGAAAACFQVGAGDLQGSYLGQTKDKVNDVFRKAQGGVLFIDEAYALAGQSLYSTEAVEQIVALTTAKEHLHKTVVILAGYTKKMDKMLRETNPGLASR